MARNPKAARGVAAEPEVPAPSRRKRGSNQADPSPEPQTASDDAAEPSLLADDTDPAPARRRPGPKAKAAAAPPEQNAGKRGRKPRQPEPDPEPLPAEEAPDSDAPRLDLGLDDAEPTAALASPEQPNATKPAAHWDQSTGTVTFDWSAIEETAAQAGPNQVMAKLLVAARAEGANSRWPL